MTPLSSPWPRGAFCAALILAACTARAADGDHFSLEATRTGRAFGPFVVRDGARIELDGRVFTMRTRPPDRASFIDVRTGRVYGPAQLTAGRLVEIGGVMYVFQYVVAAGEARPALPPVPRPPPRPVPIAVPPELLPPPPPPVVPRPVLPAPAAEPRVSFWVDPIDNTPLKWEVDGKSGSETALERISLGGGLAWRGWVAELGLSGAVSSDDILPTGFDVSEASLDSGSGWRMSGGYRQPVLRDGGWEISAGAHLTYRQDSADLRSTSLVSTPSTNDTQVLAYRTDVSSIEVTEFAAWLDAGISYHQDSWGAYAEISVLPYYDLEVDGTLQHGAEALAIEAKRVQPLTVGTGAWLAHEDWRFFGDIAVGSDQRLRLGASFAF